MTQDNNQIIEALTGFIAKEIISQQDGPTLQPDDSLLEESLIDSLGIMRLVLFIEQEYEVAIPAAEVTVENFETIRAIAAYLATNLAEHAD
jgi:acyl carrier protein